MATVVHWRYLVGEITWRWRRTLLLVGGLALAAALVVLLGVLGRSFADVATVPFRSLGADLIVQRSAVQSAVPKDMGVMLPYSAQPIAPEEFDRLAREPGVTQAGGFVLLWNLGAGRFYSISGIPLDTTTAALGPARVRDWLYQGRLPEPGKHELLVERHYGAFYRLAPGGTVEIAGRPFTVAGVVDIKDGSQIASSNFYMDVEIARSLAGLRPGLVNQVFLKVGDIGATEDVKQRIAGWMPRASVVSPGTMLQLFGGVSQTIGRFGPVVVAVGAAVALALSAMLVLGVAAERRREIAVLRVLGWTETQVRRQIAVEMLIQGLLAGLIALAVLALALGLVEHVTLTLPASLGGENPADFAGGGFKAASTAVRLPATTTVWDWIAPPVVTAAACGLWGWLWSGRGSNESLWATLKQG
ncbi:ABC transporter permease [Rhodoplanes azumiensis]|uniref:ABC transporter permease n=1 Tax=Rhodoplanes azumiensis TaxID=1897628 RepID=A0ABW5AFL8_9BRAD